MNGRSSSVSVLIWCVAVVFVWSLSACFGEEPGRNPAPDPTDPDADPLPGEPDAGPGIGFDAVKPNVMLLVDKSGSMAEPADCGEASCGSKWSQLVGLGVYLAEVKRSARLGLALFPEVNGCDTGGGVMVSLTEAANVDERIMSVLQGTFPGGSTPVASAIDDMRLTAGLTDTERDNVLVVLTDGKPNCACSQTGSDAACEIDAAVEAIQRIVSDDPVVRVHIVGFGASAAAADEALTAMAQAAGAERYYQADTIEDLIGKLYEVAIDSFPCKFDLDGYVAPANLIVWIDDAQVPACTGAPCDEGYTYDDAAMRVEVHGATCEGLRDGQPHTIWFEDATAN